MEEDHNHHYQYLKINEPSFQAGLNTRIIIGRTGNHYHKWLLEMIRWMLETRQDLVSRNLWPEIEVTGDVEMTTMPMHQTVGSGWIQNKNSATKWGSAGTSPRSKTIPNSITASSDTTVSYDITEMNHIFTTGNYKDESKPTDSVWIGISHVHLPTFWCPLYESWENHPESLHADCMAFLKKIRDKT
jgi:hypothetical protein